MGAQYDHQNLIDSIGHGVLIFDDEGKLTDYNVMAGTILGTDLKIIKDKGWQAAVDLFNANITEDEELVENVRIKALQAENPVRFHIFRSGEYVPCWASVLPRSDGKLAFVITIDVPDWSLVNKLVDRFRNEMTEAVDSTLGHINIINRTLSPKGDKADPATAKVVRSIGGFTRLIAIHMQRAGRLMGLLERLENIRTGKIHDTIRAERRRIDLEDFLEDFMEELDELDLLDPETDIQDYRSRISLVVNTEHHAYGVRRYVHATLQELLRNAIMYSLRGSPVIIKVYFKDPNIIIEVIDEGYGIRQKSWERIYKPFQRGHQPQIISEFGYGLALHLCKHEIEAMNGRLWFKSEEGVGTTFSIQLPLWRDMDAISSSTDL